LLWADLLPPPSMLRNPREMDLEEEEEEEARDLHYNGQPINGT
jgi:hypothetical protein